MALIKEIFLIWIAVCFILPPSVAIGKLKVLVIPKNTRYDFWKTVGAGAKKAGQDLDLNLMFRGPYEEDSQDTQIALIHNGIRQRVDAIVLAPTHQAKLIPAVKKAVEQGIKVVVIDSAMDGNYHSTFIASDNYRAGQKAAEYMRDRVNGPGELLMLRFVQGNLSTDNREKGFFDAIAAAPDLKIVKDPYVGVSLGSAYRVILPLLGKFPNITGVFAPCESATMATIQALRQNHLEGKITAIGFDFNEDIQKGLMDRVLHGTIVQQPYKMGYLGVKTADEILHGRSVSPRIYLETILVTRENLNAPEIRKILYPAQN